MNIKFQFCKIKIVTRKLSGNPAPTRCVNKTGNFCVNKRVEILQELIEILAYQNRFQLFRNDLFRSNVTLSKD